MCIEWSPRDVNSTICMRTIPIVMKKNNIHWFNMTHKRQRTTSSGLVSSLKSNRNLFSRLYVASQFRDGNLNGFFLLNRQTEGMSNWAPNRHCSMYRRCYIYCWRQPIEPLIEPKRAAGWGWVGIGGGKWDVVRSYLSEASKECRELLCCG